MLRCRFSCTSTHASFYPAVCSHRLYDDDDGDDDDGDDDDDDDDDADADAVDIADDTKVSFWSLFNSP